MIDPLARPPGRRPINGRITIFRHDVDMPEEYQVTIPQVDQESGIPALTEHQQAVALAGRLDRLRAEQLRLLGRALAEIEEAARSWSIACKNAASSWRRLCMAAAEARLLMPHDIKGPKLALEARLSDTGLRLACLREQARIGLQPESNRKRALNSPGASYEVLPLGYRDTPSKWPAIEREIKGLTAAIMQAASEAFPQTAIKERAANPSPLPRAFTSQTNDAAD